MSSDLRPGALARVLGVLKTLVTAVLALAGLGLFLAWMGGAFHEKIQPGVVPVERPPASGRTIVTAERVVGADTMTAIGSVQPRRMTDVASQLLAVIRELKPRPGDRLKAGEEIVVLDDRELLAQQREASASLASAEADLVTRRSNYERVQSLKGSVSAEELNNVEGAFRVAETQVRRAKETINRIEVQLTYTRIKATSDGIVSNRLAEAGDLATPGKPLLTVYDPSDLELHVNVPESLAAGLGVGKTLNIRVDANNWSTTAVIREIVPLAQQASRSVLMKLALKVPTSVTVLPGMYGRAALPIGQVERVWLSQSAIQHRGQLDLVEVVGTDGTLARRFVRVGKIEDGKVEILAGLSPGERVALPLN